MPESKRRIPVVVAVILAIAVLAAVGYLVTRRDGGTGIASEEIVVGSLLALSGPDRSFGITQQQGMKIALEEIEAAGGVAGRPLRIEFADTQLNEDLGLQEYKRLTTNPKIRAIVGVTGSGVALRIAPFANQDEVVLLSSLDTSPKLTAAGPYFFRNIASDSYSGVVLSNWVVERGETLASLIYNSENAWSRGCREAVEEAYAPAGGSMVVESTAVLDSTDNFSPMIITFREATPTPQAVFVCLMGRQAGLFVSQAKANRLDTPFYGTDPFSQQEFIDNAQDALGQSFFVLPGEGATASYETFAATYRKQYGSEADSIAAKAYDAVHLLAAALENVIRKEKELSGPNIRESLAGIQHEGITGMNSFDENGDLEQANFDQFTYRNGQRVKL